MDATYEGSNWRRKYATLKDYYADKYPSKYYSFSKYELEIDPSETMEDLEQYDFVRQQKEMVKCKHSFSYFAMKFAKVAHPKFGLVPFILYNYQKRALNDYDAYKNNIISKFRQGGLTTVTTIWCLWRAMFKPNRETIMFVSKTDREAKVAGEIINTVIDNFPTYR